MEARQHERLMLALAEQLQVPLLQIARLSELGELPESTFSDRRQALQQIMVASSSAMRLLDAYMLTLRVHESQMALELGPTSLASAVNDTAHTLSPLAKAYGCELRLSVRGKYEPVMANGTALENALVSLGYALIESAAAKGRRPVLHLGVHRGRSGLVVGIFGEMGGLQAPMYRRAKQLLGRARQPIISISATSSAGLFIADSLLSAMDSDLKVARHQKLVGFGATFLPSQQLALL